MGYEPVVCIVSVGTIDSANGLGLSLLVSGVVLGGFWLSDYGGIKFFFYFLRSEAE